MRSIIFYGSKQKLTNAHKLATGPKQPKYYIRAKIVWCGDIDALYRAKPMDGETVLNTIQLD